MEAHPLSAKTDEAKSTVFLITIVFPGNTLPAHLTKSKVAYGIFWGLYRLELLKIKQNRCFYSFVFYDLLGKIFQVMSESHAKENME